MASYTYYIASASLSDMKAEYPAPHSMIVLVNPSYPVVNDLRFYDWHSEATDTPDDFNVVLPQFPEFGLKGRWLKVNIEGDPQVNSDWTAVSGPSAILNKPAFSSIAFSGQYSDLSGTPEIPGPQVQSDWLAFDGPALILNKPYIPPQQIPSDWNAVSGLDVILNKPTIPAAQVNSDWNATSGIKQVLNKPTLAPVATSGSYNDLTSKPTIPSAFVLSVGAPTVRTVALDTAYQATTVGKPAIVTVTLTSTTALSLTGGATYEADLIIGPTSAVASGTGTVVGKYKNSLTGTLVVGLAINNSQTNTYDLALPAGWYFAVRQITGAGISVVSAFDQLIG